MRKKISMNINAKMLTYILTALVVIFTLSVGYISIKTRQMALNDAEKLAQKVSLEYATKIEKELLNDFIVLRTLQQAYSVYTDMDTTEWKPLFAEMYKKVYANTPNIYKLWDSWELRFFDPKWTKPHGRFVYQISRKNGEIHLAETYRSLDGDPELYARIKATRAEGIWEPYWDVFTDANEEKKFMTTLSVPMIVNNEFAGLIGADIIMDRFQAIVESIKPFDENIAFLTSNTGIIVGHPDKTCIGEKISDYHPYLEEQISISEIIKNGELKTAFIRNDKNEKVIISIAPINIINAKVKTPWALAIMVPERIVLAEANRNQMFGFIVSIIGLIIISLIVFILAGNISKSLKKTTLVLEKLSEGDIKNTENLDINTNDEVELMAQSVNQLMDGIRKTAEFAGNIGKGNLDAEFTPLSEKDILGNALIEMRNSLKRAEEEEKKRKIEDEKHNWATTGLAKFGDILRSHTNSIEELSFHVMSNLINYVDANQGAIFIAERDDRNELTFELKSAIAYDRQKYMEKTIREGEGLIGRCAFEKKSIFMTDIPQNYIKITSGMGTANPSNLLLVPCILNDEIYGVIELASFTKFEQYKIDFVERFGESIASTIASVKVNEKTNRLLEQSKQQAEELAAQEEEMRQNLEELQATQEESARKEMEMSGLIDALSTTAFTVEYDLDGTILNANQKYIDLLGIPKEHLIGAAHADGYNWEEHSQLEYNTFWNNLRRGITQKTSNKVTYKGKEIYVEETYTPLRRSMDEPPYKILKIAFDITERVLQEKTLKENHDQLQAEADEIENLKMQLQHLQEQLEHFHNTPYETTEEQTIAPVEIKEEEPEIPESKDALLDWNENMETEVEEMDNQRKQLLSLANAMYCALRDNKPKKENKDNLKNLIDFASYHFRTEEQYFDEFGFEQAQLHANDHQKFIKLLTKLQSDYTSGKLSNFNNVSKQISKWLFIHFTSMDTQYSELFKENGL